MRIQLVLNANIESVLAFRNVRQSTVEKVDFVDSLIMKEHCF